MLEEWGAAEHWHGQTPKKGAKHSSVLDEYRTLLRTTKFLR